MADSPDSTYLKGTVGEALARGVAAVIAAQPSDPVDYLGNWLLKYVANGEIEKKYFKEKQAAIDKRQQEEAEKIAAEAAAKSAAEERAAAVAALAELRDEPRKLFAAAVALLVKYTSAGAAYVAAVADKEEADWAGGEEGGEEGGADTDDDAPKEDEEEEEEDEEEEEEEAEEEEEGGPPKPKYELPPDYSQKHLAYIVASAGQEAVEGKDLYRPGPPEDEEAPELPAVTFRMLDEQLPMLVVPQVAAEPRIKFMGPMPKIGGYAACAVTDAKGEYKAVLAADSLLPGSHGQKLTAEDTELMWQTALALSKAFDASVSANAGKVVATAGAAVLAELNEKLDVIKPPPEEGEEGGGGEEEEGEEEEEEEDPEVEPEEGEDEAVALARAKLERLEGKLPVMEEKLAKASAALGVEEEALIAILGALQEVRAAALQAFRWRLVVPQATYHALKAVLHMLGKPAASFASWKLCNSYFGEASRLFDEMVVYDAKQPRNMAVWKRIRSCYKAVASRKKVKALAEEFPDTAVGALLIQYVKQVRRVARRADAQRTAERKLTDVKFDMEAKQRALEAAIKDKEERDAKEAEEEARRRAEEGEDEEEEGEEEEDDE